MRIHLKSGFVFHFKGRKGPKHAHSYAADKEAEDQRGGLAKLKKLWLMDNLYQGLYPPLNLYSEFCVYKYFLEEKVYGRHWKLMVLQIRHMSDAVRWKAVGTGRECGQPDTTYPTERKSCYLASVSCYRGVTLA